MAISIVEVQSNSQPTANTRAIIFDSSWTPALNDLVVFFGGADGAITTLTVPAAWVNPLGGTTSVAADANVGAIEYHWVTAGEVSAVTRTYTVSTMFSPSRAGVAAAVVLRGVDTTTPIDSISSIFDSADTVTPHVLPGLTGLGTGSLMLSWIYPDDAVTYTTPSGWTAQIVQNIGVAGRNVWVGSRDALTAGADISNTSITPSAGGEYVAVSVAFNPLGGGGGGGGPVVSNGQFFMFMPPTRGGGDPNPTMLHDAGLSEPFQFATEPTGTIRNVTAAPYNAAPGNSAVDSRVGINAAIVASASGDIVYLPDGDYYIKGSASGLLFGAAKAGVTLRGQSKTGTRLVTALSGSPHSVIYMQGTNAAPGNGGHIIENLTIMRSSGSIPEMGIRFSDNNLSLTQTNQSNQRCIVRNVVIRDYERVGIGLQNTKHVLVENCTISNATALDGLGSGYGVCLDGPMTNNNWVRNCTLGPIIRHALLAVDVAHHNLFGGTLDGLPGALPWDAPLGNECGNSIVGAVSGAIDMHGEIEFSIEMSYNIVHDNVRDGTTVSPNGAGIEIGEPPTDEVLGGTGHGKSGMYMWAHHNEIYGCPAGIRIMNNSNWEFIEDNWCHGNDDGILVDQTDGYPNTGVDHIYITRNRVEGNLNGVRLVDLVTNAQVRNNTIINNTGFGIFGDANTTGYLITGNTITGNGTNVSLAGAGTYIP